MNSLVKRSIDLTVSILGLVLLSPLMVVIALAILFCIGRPVFFRQVRPGYEAKPFTLLKFRTMNSARDERGSLLPDEERLTNLGGLLRRYSLDELPQFWNVLKGEMSLVGPRPLLMQYLGRYTPEQARRHEVKPGISGWAQVNGRNALTWEEKFDKDVWYADHMSPWLDAKIIVQTIWNVFRRRGINQPGMATAEEFMGTHQESAESWISSAGAGSK